MSTAVSAAVLDVLEASKTYTAKQRDKAPTMDDGSFPIETEADLGRAIQAYGRAKDKDKAKAWIIRRAKALGATSKLPDGWNVSEAEVVEEAHRFRSVKARNLRAGHVVHHGGHTQTVVRAEPVTGPWSGDKIRTVLDGPSGTKDFDPEERLSVATATVEAAVSGALDEVLEANLRDAAASRARWARWESLHGKPGSLESRNSRGHVTSEPGKAHVGSLVKVKVKGSGYSGTITQSHGGAYSVKVERSAKAGAEAGPNRPQQFPHDKLELLPKGAQIHTGHGVFVSGKNGMVHPDDHEVAKGLPGVVERHNGDLHVSSNLPKGAAVQGNKVTFPGDPGHPSKSAPVGSGSRESAAKAGAAGKAAGAPKSKLAAAQAASGPEPDPEHVKSVLGSGANVRKAKDGHAVGGFSMPPKHAQDKLRAAGYEVKDNFGQTTITGMTGARGSALKAARSAGYEAADVAAGKPTVKSVESHLASAGIAHGGAFTEYGPGVKVKVNDPADREKIRQAVKGKGWRVQNEHPNLITVHKVQEADMTDVETAVLEAADSLAKASSPEPFSKSKTSNWVARGGGLPAYVQHVAHDLVEKRGKTVSEAIRMAVGIIRNWAEGKGKVDANTRAAATKAMAEWAALRAKSAARKAAAA